jgi:hypothetical protein
LYRFIEVAEQVKSCRVAGAEVVQIWRCFGAQAEEVQRWWWCREVQRCRCSRGWRYRVQRR